MVSLKNLSTQTVLTKNSMVKAEISAKEILTVTTKADRIAITAKIISENLSKKKTTT